MKVYYHSLVFCLLTLIYISCSSPEASEIQESSSFPEEMEISFIQEGYQNGDFSIQDITSHYLEQIQKIDDSGPMLNSVIEINPDALEIAKELDQELSEGKSRGPMHGIPVLLKDNIDTHDKMSTTAGSRALQGSKPLQDSWVAAKLRESGAVILGKANLSEWANFRGQRSSSGWSAIGGQTKNPYILDRNPCGSSSGSGASVSANLTVLAIGTETNGSIVCPSSANGIVGIKPTVGLVSRSGVIPISFTQDTPGPMARNLRDAAICLGVLTGQDENDSKTTASEGKSHTDYTQFLKEGSLEGKRIGWFTQPSSSSWKVHQLMEQAIEFMKNQGAEIVEIEDIISVGGNSYQVMLYEYKDGLNSYFASLGENAPIKSLEDLIEFNENDTVEMQFYNQHYLKEAQEKGPLTEQAYLDALEAARKGSQDEGIDRVMNEHNLDAIVAPTGSPAWKTDWVNGDCFHVSSSSPAAISGYPNITVPMGYIEELPVGISFFGRAWSEPLLLEIAYSYEQGTKHRKAPRFLTPEESEKAIME